MRWMRLMRWLFVVTLVATVAGAAAAAVLPGAHRMVCPACYGLDQIAPGVFTDAKAGRHEAMRTQLKAARLRAAAFFGDLEARPNIVLCTQITCLQTFSARTSNAAGVTFGWAFVRMAARGIRTDTLTHELVHAEYHWRLGLMGFVEGRVPFWFHEGLASWIARDSAARTRRYRGRQPWTREMRTQAEWNAIPARLGKLNYRYAAAVAEVDAIVARIGVDGLRRVVDLTTQGATLDQALGAQAPQ